MQIQRACALCSTDIGTVICGQRFRFVCMICGFTMCENFFFSEVSSCLFNEGRWEWSQKCADFVVVVWSFCDFFFFFSYYGKLQFWQKWNAFVKLPQERLLYIRSKVNCFCRRPHPIWEIQFSSSASLFFCFCSCCFPFFLSPPSGPQTIVNTSCKSALVATVLEVLGP